MDDTDKNEHERDTGPDAASQKKRRTVNVMCAVPNGLQIRRHTAAAHPFAPQLPTGEGYMLQAGNNPGVDREWFEAWLDENKNLSVVQSGQVTIGWYEPDPDEEPEKEPAKAE